MALHSDACGFGFVVDIQGRASHDIVEKALTVLMNLEHRGAVGAEKNTGDGAGILVQVPHGFLRERCGKLGFALPGAGQYGLGMVFLPPSAEGRAACERRAPYSVRLMGPLRKPVRTGSSNGRVAGNPPGPRRRGPRARRTYRM